MSKITPLMTSLHIGHKAEERMKCIDNMLFKKCEDTKDTILQAFWWYRKNSIPLDKVKQVREEIQELIDKCGKDTMADIYMKIGLDLALTILNELITESEVEE